MFKLSILICSLSERTEYLISLLKELNKQLVSEVEVLILIDNRELSIGQKRNNLLNSAKGKYVCFIDDDDKISEDYLSEIMKGVEKDVDQIAISGIYHNIKEGTKTRFTSSKDFQWGLVDNEYRRNILHLNPIKRELALKVGFPDNSFGEDRTYGEQLSPYVKTEYRILKEIYFYEYSK